MNCYVFPSWAVACGMLESRYSIGAIHFSLRTKRQKKIVHRQALRCECIKNTNKNAFRFYFIWIFQFTQIQGKNRTNRKHTTCELLDIERYYIINIVFIAMCTSHSLQLINCTRVNTIKMKCCSVVSTLFVNSWTNFAIIYFSVLLTV